MVTERRVLKVGDRVPVDDRALPVAIGMDVLADSFGEHVYLATRLNDDHTLEAECPLSGEWTGFGYSSSFLLKSDNPAAHKQWLPAEPLLGDQVVRWTRVRVDLVLAKERPRYYLPRAWNPAADGWVTHEELKSRLEQFLKEREDANSR